MTVFVDASALVSMMTAEEDDELLVRQLAPHNLRLYSAVVWWETAVAIARKRKISVEETADEMETFIADFGMRPVTIGPGEAREAAVAWQRYGKLSGHSAQLNMGDCFAYACAKTNDARLLYKGNDFSHTDVALP